MTGVRRRIDEIRIAMMLLTRFPMGRVADPVPTLADARWAYPLAGLPVGLATGLAFSAALWVGLEPMLAAWLAVGTGAIVTGGLHHDGLADVADGFWGGHSAERRLEIMRDSRMGSYGVIAIVITLSVLAQSIEMISPQVHDFVAIAVLSRCAMVFVLISMRPARGDGLGYSAQIHTHWHGLIILGFGGAAVLLLGALGIVAAIVGALVPLGIGALAYRKIGGQTGDVLGATQLVSATAMWVALAALA